MKKHKLGFTLVEVSLFLGITALLFAGITIGTQNSITQQRYTDSVDGFVDFLRNIYADVSNPRGDGKGMSEQALYGKVVLFGDKDKDGTYKIGTYDLVGDVESSFAGDTLQKTLKELNAGVIATTEGSFGTSSTLGFQLAGASQYTPRWSTTIENANGELFVGVIVVARHPQSGTINTLVYDDRNASLKLVDAISKIADVTIILNSNGTCNSSLGAEACARYASLKNEMTSLWDNIKTGTVEFCVNPFGDSARRQEVKILENARNASGVEVLNLDSSENTCNN